MTGVTPRKSLGQHFLVDRNVLGVIDRLARLSADDVVLEIGPGSGVLTRYLADRVAIVHAVELDRRLEAPLAELTAAAPNVRVLWGDALRLDLAALDPPATKVVANLPYNIATPLVAESVTHLSQIDTWCVMVQREVAERLFAVPSTKAYGAVSVLVQLATCRTGFHPVARTVFRPVPRVDSALVAFARQEDTPQRLSEIRTLADAAFAHRRKTLANSLALTGTAARDTVEAALARIGRDRAVRAEALTPREFVALDEALRSC